MGEPILVVFGVLAFVGMALVLLGALRRAVNLIVVGSAILLAIAWAWVFGLFGAAAGSLHSGS